MGQEGKRHAEDVDVFGIEETRFGIDLVGRAPQSPAHHLFAQKLACEGAQAHDVRDGLGIPSFRKHPDRYNVLNLLAGLAGLPNGIHLLAQKLGLLFLGQLAFRPVALLFPLTLTIDLRQRLLGGLGFIEHPRVNVQRSRRVT